MIVWQTHPTDEPTVKLFKLKKKHLPDFMIKKGKAPLIENWLLLQFCIYFFIFYFI